jgi:glyoxylase-like metal-dependent hydrolase (beta-lactamase superfamily II)
MFGSVPKTVWEKMVSVDERNRIPLAMRALLLRGKGRSILIDDGMGTKWSPKLADMYGVDHAEFSPQKSLAGLGLSCEEITDVILTHLHFDHGGGTTYRDGNGDLHLTFPNATHYVQRENWEHALRPNEREAASYLRDDFLPLERSGCLKLLEGPGELFPGVRLRIFYGHTTGMQLPVISGGGRTVFFCADLVPTSRHLGIPYVMGYDIRAVDTMAEKRKLLLEEAIPQEWVLFFEHDPDTVACTAAVDAKGKVVRKEEVAL